MTGVFAKVSSLLLRREGCLSALPGNSTEVLMSTAREWLRKYWRDQRVGKRKGTGLCRVSSPAQDVALVAEAERNTFFSTRDLNPLTPHDPYSGRTAPLNSKRCILYIYSTNIGTEYFKHGIYSPVYFRFKMQFAS